MLINKKSYILMVLRSVSHQQYAYEGEFTNLSNRRALQEQWASFVAVEKRTKNNFY